MEPGILSSMGIALSFLLGRLALPPLSHRESMLKAT